MKHRKTLHPKSVPTCDKFVKGQCSRTNQECWFEHINSNHIPNSSNPAKKQQEKEQVFQEPLGNIFPPDQMKLMMTMVSNLVKKVENIEKKFESLMK